jgi:hypothetical protein
MIKSWHRSLAFLVLEDIQMKMLIAALLLAATPAMAQDCQIINGALNCGNSSVTGQSYGNQLYFSNGTTGTRYGDRTYFSDGTTGTTYGNKTYLSNGKVCQQYGGQLNCN